MKTPYKNIYDTLKFNRYVVIAVVIGSVVTSVVSVLLNFKLHQKVLNTAFAVNQEGSVIPLKLVSQRENLNVEVLSHLELFHTYFYHMNASNYEKNIEKSLWLGNSSVDALYQQKRADGVYNRLLQYSLIQKVISVESKVNIEQKPYGFKTVVRFEINRGTVVDAYELTTSGKLIHVERNFPKNPHGLLITDFYENRLKKIKAE